MSNDLQAGICSGSWWRTGGFDAQQISAASVSASASISDASSSGGAGAGAFTWSAAEMVESKSRSSHEPFTSASGTTITFQDQVSDRHMVGAGGGLSMDWPQPLLSSSGTGSAETSFHAMLQEDLSSTPYFRQDPDHDHDHAHGGGVHDSSMNLFKNMNQSFLMEQHQMNAAANEPGGCSNNINNFSLAPAAAVLQGMMEPADMKPRQSIYDNGQADYHQSPMMMGYHGGPSESPRSSWPKFTQFLDASPPKPQQACHQLHFSNTTPFWNASAAAGFYPPMPPQFAAQTFDKKPNCTTNNLALKSSSQVVSRDSSSTTTKRSSEPAFKKPRMETPSPLPTFKVRKEKLGDRITALQQLVSPFGKTDTASVLHEAIDYIKFLHDQVTVLSTSYLKNGNPTHQQQNADKSKDRQGPKQDLRSRGLCLVPVASTYPMASETPLDFWNPTYGGTYR